MTSSSIGEPSGRLATPKTRREETVSSPKTSRSSSDAASATFGCSVNSGVAATYTPSRMTQGGEHPAQEKEMARLNGRHVRTKRRWRIRQMNAELGETVLGSR